MNGTCQMEVVLSHLIFCYILKGLRIIHKDESKLPSDSPQSLCCHFHKPPHYCFYSVLNVTVYFQFQSCVIYLGETAFTMMKDLSNI